jgi:hypothetical protein
MDPGELPRAVNIVAISTHQTTVTLCADGRAKMITENGHRAPARPRAPALDVPSRPGGPGEIAMRVALHVGEMPDRFHVARIVLGYRCNSQQPPH